MTEIIWTLLLTVCASDRCATQTIQWFDEKPQCIEMQLIHEELPQDGHWQSVEYSCSMVNGEAA